MLIGLICLNFYNTIAKCLKTTRIRINLRLNNEEGIIVNQAGISKLLQCPLFQPLSVGRIQKDQIKGLAFCPGKPGQRGRSIGCEQLRFIRKTRVFQILTDDACCL